MAFVYPREKAISTETREYATFEDQGNSYVWTREEHDPNTGPDVLLNLSVSLLPKYVPLTAESKARRNSFS